VGMRFSAPLQADPGSHSASWRWVPDLFPSKAATYLHLMPRLKKE